MLKLNKINSFYNKAHVLFDVSLEMAAGQIIGLFGRNGAGKTTTFRSIMGLHPTICQGEILYKGINISGQAPYRIARQGIGFVPEDRRIFPNLTVRKNLIVGRKKAVFGLQKWDLDEVYLFFPKLKELEHKLGSQLSGGEQQMLTIGRALMGNPELLLLDEPTEGLAPVIAQHLIEMMLKIKQEFQISILVVEQFSAHVLNCLDKCYVMDMGRIIWEGDPQILKRDEILQKKLFGVGAYAEEQFLNT
ncbi:MAG: ABC transporter ATP-binding protein [Deltaproteobacteria bacterium]|nr:MAG: ABC transporter ATP-binding protein [Deltaproteobacteria bacterium]RPJ15342.1 MAG: ABC transporter ATP-binding protein [Deltaproteobacteria bacterium]